VVTPEAASRDPRRRSTGEETSSAGVRRHARLAGSGHGGLAAAKLRGGSCAGCSRGPRPIQGFPVKPMRLCRLGSLSPSHEMRVLGGLIMTLLRDGPPNTRLACGSAMGFQSSRSFWKQSDLLSPSSAQSLRDLRPKINAILWFKICPTKNTTLT